MGLLSVEFSEEVLQALDSNITWIDSSIIELSIEPKQVNANLSSLNFTWETVSLVKNLLEIQLNFDTSAYISNDIV